MKLEIKPIMFAISPPYRACLTPLIAVMAQRADDGVVRIDSIELSNLVAKQSLQKELLRNRIS